ncbi:hypothetical protein ACFQ9J_17375 [Streptomyces sp. NPDC056529]|uniref:hypothetical protein n=1 Tax=Streptomyces sp. NPDC056529 TaxID=3345855 RepID=UPI0036A078D0
MFLQLKRDFRVPASRVSGFFWWSGQVMAQAPPAGSFERLGALTEWGVPQAREAHVPRLLLSDVA